MKEQNGDHGFVIAVLLAIVGTLALVGYIISEGQGSRRRSARRRLRRRRLVPKGADRRRSGRRSRSRHIRARESGRSPIRCGGRRRRSTDLQPGDRLVAARLVAGGQVTQEVTDKVQISTLLAAERAVGGTLKKGGLVGSTSPRSLRPRRLRRPRGERREASTEPGRGRRPTDAVEAPRRPRCRRRSRRTCHSCKFRHVLVTRRQAHRHAGQPRRQGVEDGRQVAGSQYVVTLALSPEQSESIFVFAQESGHVSLSNEPATVSDDGTRLVTLGNVYTVVK